MSLIANFGMKDSPHPAELLHSARKKANQKLADTGKMSHDVSTEELKPFYDIVVTSAVKGFDLDDETDREDGVDEEEYAEEEALLLNDQNAEAAEIVEQILEDDEEEA